MNDKERIHEILVKFGQVYIDRIEGGAMSIMEAGEIVEKEIFNLLQEATTQARREERERIEEKGRSKLFDHPKAGSYEDGWNDGIDAVTDILWGKESPIKPTNKETEQILKLLGQDSCACGECEWDGMKIDVSCRKSNGAKDYFGGVVRIEGSDKKEMNRIGKELVKELRETWSSEFNLVLDLNEQKEGNRYAKDTK